MKPLKGYFGVGVEGVSKPMNLGAVLRTAHAFGASFAFTIGATAKAREVFRADTARSIRSVPYYGWDDLDEMVLPHGCRLIGVELDARAVDLPTFRHPRNAAYVLGRERGSLSEALVERCDFVVRIPTRFCVNLSVAAAITLYDRSLVMGGWPDRPVRPGGPDLPAPETWRRPGRAEP